MEIEYIMALITLMAVVASFASARAARDGVQTGRDQIAASIDIAEKQIEASKETAERQIRAELVSANRQKWIETLRAQIVDLLSASTDVSKSLSRRQDAKDELTCLHRAAQTVALHLNPHDELHRRLGKELGGLADYTVQGAIDALGGAKNSTQVAIDTFGEKHRLIHEAAHAVLLAESELVRRGE